MQKKVNPLQSQILSTFESRSRDERRLSREGGDLLGRLVTRTGERDERRRRSL